LKGHSFGPEAAGCAVHCEGDDVIYGVHIILGEIRQKQQD
jgi:hypothetical protein